MTDSPLPADTTSPLERETSSESDTTSFDYFGRSWTVPTKRHTRHLLRMRDEARLGYSTWPLIVCETFLEPKAFDALIALDPDEHELDAFADKIGEALGLKDAGNS